MLDASVIVSAALRRGSTPDRAFEIGPTSCRFVLSAAVEAEVQEVLSRPKFDRTLAPERKQAFLDRLAFFASRVEPTERVRGCRDPDDDKYLYLELALAASADILVSGDQDLLVPDPWRGVRVLSPAAFVALWDAPPP